MGVSQVPSHCQPLRFCRLDGALLFVAFCKHINHWELEQTLMPVFLPIPIYVPLNFPPHLTNSLTAPPSPYISPIFPHNQFNLTPTLLHSWSSKPYSLCFISVNIVFLDFLDSIPKLPTLQNLPLLLDFTVIYRVKTF